MRILIYASIFFLFSCSGDSVDDDPAFLDSSAARKSQITDSLMKVSERNLFSSLVGHCTNPAGAPKQDSVVWKLPAGELTASEKKIAGTWIATLGDIALTTGNTMMMIDSTSGKKGMDALVDAVEKQHIADQGCAWLEFYDDHTGFWNSCMLNNGSPTALDNVDPFSGEHSGSGVKFEWYREGKKIRIKFEDCLKFPLEKYTVRVKYWDLEMIAQGDDEDGLATWTMRDHLPEYKFASIVKYKYLHSPKTLNGKMGKYKSAVMD